MSETFPILHVRSIERDGEDRRGAISVSQLAGLGRRLRETAFATPAAPFVIHGWLPTAGGEEVGYFLTHETRREPVAYWCSNLGARGYGSFVAVTPDEFESPGGIGPRDVPHLAGHGVVVASRGLTGEPLVGADVAEIREELTESRRRLSEACGYPVRTLVPPPSVAGRAFDGLVDREARRAGYALLLGPGPPGEIAGLQPDGILGYRTRERGEDADDLLDWLIGRGFSRETARLRSLASTPRAVLDRLEDAT